MDEPSMNLPEPPAPNLPSPSQPTQTAVRKYKGERDLAKGLAKMQADGWQVQSRTSRKLWWRWTSGIFTRKQLHTVTFTR
jgi:hypothetical protein